MACSLLNLWFQALKRHFIVHERKFLLYQYYSFHCEILLHSYYLYMQCNIGYLIKFILYVMSVRDKFPILLHWLYIYGYSAARLATLAFPSAEKFSYVTCIAIPFLIMVYNTGFISSLLTSVPQDGMICVKDPLELDKIAPLQYQGYYLLSRICQP